MPEQTSTASPPPQHQPPSREMIGFMIIFIIIIAWAVFSLLTKRDNDHKH